MVSRWIPSCARDFSSSPQCPNWLFDSPGLLLSWYRRFFTGSKAADVLAIHLNLVLRLRMSGVLPLLPLHAVMACRAATFTTPASLHYLMYIRILQIWEKFPIWYHFHLLRLYSVEGIWMQAWVQSIGGMVLIEVNRSTEKNTCPSATLSTSNATHY